MTETVINYATAKIGPAPAAPQAIDLSSADFQFVYHPDPNRFFRGPRPYRLFESKPSIATYHNAIYTPTVRQPKNRVGCLYDENLNRIEASLVRRRRTDDLVSHDPERYPGNPKDLPVYDRPVLYIGEFRPHFGHFILESIAHWWGLTEELGDIDRFLFHISDPGILERPHVKACLAALGIDRSQMVSFDHPVRLRQAIVPGPSYQGESHIYRKYKEIYNKLSLALGADAAQTSDQPVYFSRTLHKHGVREYVGEEHVEAFLAERGVRIVHPQLLPFVEQFRAVNEHKHIIGFQGSQLTNIVGALEPKQVTYFTDEHAWGGCFLLNKCFDHTATFVKVCESDRVTETFYHRVMRRLTGRRVRRSEFLKAHRVDHEQTIAWLKASGIV